MGYRQVTSTGSCQYREDGGLEARVIGNIKLTRLPRLSVLAYAIFGAHFCAVFVYPFLYLFLFICLMCSSGFGCWRPLVWLEG